MKKTVYLIGAGPGSPDTLTLEARKAIESSGLLLGARRLLEPYSDFAVQCKIMVRAEEIAEEIHSSQAEVISVLLSGDPGFYSGARNLYPLLEDCGVITIPGISSVNCFCARLHTTWQDAALFSAHGRDCNVVGEVQTHAKCIFLTGGKLRAQDLCRQLSEAGYGELRACAGENLSYPEERILRGTAEELSREQFEDLTILMVENPEPVQVNRFPRAPAIPDEEFQRGKVPMTKEMVRLAVLAALRIREDDIVWDVGAGTGSVSIACALAAGKGSVYAVERKAEAVELIRENQARHGAWNLHVVEGEAPEALQDLPAPDRVFIGGSSGRMKDIFSAVLAGNPRARVVLTAVTLESLTEGLQCMQEFRMEDVDVNQITAARAREAGNYHLMSGENPVWILSGTGSGVQP